MTTGYKIISNIHNIFHFVFAVSLARVWLWKVSKNDMVTAERRQKQGQPLLRVEPETDNSKLLILTDQPNRIYLNKYKTAAFSKKLPTLDA